MHLLVNIFIIVKSTYATLRLQCKRKLALQRYKKSRFSFLEAASKNHIKLKKRFRAYKRKRDAAEPKLDDDDQIASVTTKSVFKEAKILDEANSRQPSRASSFSVKNLLIRDDEESSKGNKNLKPLELKKIEIRQTVNDHQIVEEPMEYTRSQLHLPTVAKGERV